MSTAPLASSPTRQSPRWSSVVSAPPISTTGTSFSVLPSSDCSPRTSSVGATPRPCSVARSVVPAAEMTRCSSKVNSFVGRKRTWSSSAPCGGSLGSALSSEKGPVGSRGSASSWTSRSLAHGHRTKLQLLPYAAVAEQQHGAHRRGLDAEVESVLGHVGLALGLDEARQRELLVHAPRLRHLLGLRALLALLALLDIAALALALTLTSTLALCLRLSPCLCLRRRRLATLAALALALLLLLRLRVRRFEWCRVLYEHTNRLARLQRPHQR
eukprot:scaffold70882_cov62-Phaeocystis_antarctica.AAC.5